LSVSAYCMSTYNMQKKEPKPKLQTKKIKIPTKRQLAIATAFAEIRKLKKQKRIRNKPSLLA